MLLWSRASTLIPEDVKAVAIPTLAHRLGHPRHKKQSTQDSPKKIVVREILAQTPVGI